MMILAIIVIPFARADEVQWRIGNLENMLLVKTDRGDFLIELAPGFAPNHVRHMKKLTRESFFNNRPFYRVIENFIAQTGSGDDMAEFGNKNVEKLIAAEFTRTSKDDFPFVSIGHGDAYADEIGFCSGFPVGLDRQTERAWVTHCPGIVGMARNDNPNSGGTDWFIVIGQSPRHLDRNITVFGRVIDGLEVVLAMPHGIFVKEGAASKKVKPGRIKSIVIVADLPKKEQPLINIENVHSKRFSARLEQRKNRNAAWYVHSSPPVVDICTVGIATQIKWPKK